MASSIDRASEFRQTAAHRGDTSARVMDAHVTLEEASMPSIDTSMSMGTDTVLGVRTPAAWPMELAGDMSAAAAVLLAVAAAPLGDGPVTGARAAPGDMSRGFTAFFAGMGEANDAGVEVTITAGPSKKTSDVPESTFDA